MKIFAASIATFAAMAQAAEVEGHPAPVDYNAAVHNFDFCENVIVQSDYEDYINEAANILIALEAFRQEIVRLTHDVEDLEICIEGNNWDIKHNESDKSDNDDRINYNDAEIKDQQYRLKRVQKTCRYCQSRLEEDR